MLRRQRARLSLIDYCRAIDIPGAPASDDPEAELFKPVETAMAAHHILLCQFIQRVMQTAMGRGMLLLPPGSAKSTYASVCAPAWSLSTIEGQRIILASYAIDIAEKHSRKQRGLVRSLRHTSIWEHAVTLAKDQRAVGQWALSNGSEFMAAGMLSGITGNRANGIIIDDPVKGREEADSEVIRNKIEDEYNDAVTTRLLPGGWVFLINTRWHEDDLSGRILPEDYDGRSGRILCRDGQWWDVLNIPAKAEHPDDPLGRAIGEYLWPEWFPREHWGQWENNPRASRTWSALFQQRPTAGEGLEFRREWFKWFDPDVKPGEPGGLPASLTYYGATDNATKEDKGDYTEHGVMGLDRNLDFWILDWWYGQKTTDVTIAEFIKLVRLHHPRRWWNEGGPIDNAISPAVRDAMQNGKPPCYVQLEALTSVKNKAIKAASFQARAAAGRVHLPMRREWATRLVDQLCGFPAAKYDDAVDVCGLLGRGIDSMMRPYDPEARPERKGLKPFTAEWLEYTENRDVKPRYF